MGGRAAICAESKVKGAAVSRSPSLLTTWRLAQCAAAVAPLAPSFLSNTKRMALNSA